MGDTGIRSPLGHQRQYFALALAQHAQRVVSPACRYEFGHQSRVDHRGSPGDPLQRIDEIGDVGDAALEQITDAVTGSQQVHRIVDGNVCGKHHDRRVRQFLPDQPGGVQALAGVGGWHPDVGDHEAGRHRANLADQLFAVTGLADDFESRALEQTGQARPKQDVVVGQHHSRRLGHQSTPSCARGAATSRRGRGQQDDAGENLPDHDRVHTGPLDEADMRKVDRPFAVSLQHHGQHQARHSDQHSDRRDTNAPTPHDRRPPSRPRWPHCRRQSPEMRPSPCSQS